MVLLFVMGCFAEPPGYPTEPEPEPEDDAAEESSSSSSEESSGGESSGLEGACADGSDPLVSPNPLMPGNELVGPWCPCETADDCAEGELCSPVPVSDEYYGQVDYGGYCKPEPEPEPAKCWDGYCRDPDEDHWAITLTHCWCYCETDAMCETGQQCIPLPVTPDGPEDLGGYCVPTTGE